MGRPFMQFVDEEQHAKFVCVSCAQDVASDKAIVWEGYMSARRPSRLFRNTVNVDQCPSERQEHLTSGVYTLADVRCRGCNSTLGWRYIAAQRKDQKFKEGGTLIDNSKLRRVSVDVAPPERPCLL